MQNGGRNKALNQNGSGGDVVLDATWFRGFRLNRNAIKIIACLAMVCDHVGIAFFAYKGLAWTICRLYIGRIAFPLFGMLFIEGCFETHHKVRHIIECLIFGFLSNPAYHALIGKSGWNCNNVMFTWAICSIICFVLRLYYLDEREEHESAEKAVDCLLFLMIGIFGGYYLGVDYGYMGVLAVGMAAYYHAIHPLSTPRVYGIGLTVILAILSKNYGTLLAIPIMLLYDERRKARRLCKYAFYLFYPGHIGLILLAQYLLERFPVIR